ncbi:MAG: ACP phosphodiesterase [Thermaurantimonas sp.]|uniref:acyl carrier protein phosphodiesterase n=1 Tax=Thermaurantimonas sp. TaxID=2681568 RepID=UPI00391DE5BB
MNYLGHLYLSPHDAPFRLGNLMADGLPARTVVNYPSRMQLGYRFHLWIDDFTDRHPSFKHSRELLAVTQRHYAGVVADVLYDHFLAKNWAKYSNESLEDFSQTFYVQYQSYLDVLPEKFTYMMQYMVRYRWLESYASVEGLQQALSGLGRRSRYKNNMHTAIEDIYANYEQLECDFLEFMAEIRRAARKWLTDHNGFL